MKYLLLTLFAFFTISANSQIVLEEKSIYGPITYDKPFAWDEKSPEDKSFDISDFINDLAYDKEAQNYNNFPKLNIPKNEAKFDSEDGLLISLSDSSSYSLFVLRSYLNVEEFRKTEIELRTNAIFSMDIDGKTILQNSAFPDSIEQKEKTEELIKGPHAVSIFLMSKPGQKNIRIKLEVGTDSTIENYSFSAENDVVPVDLHTLANLPNVNSAKISSDAELAALSLSRKTTPTGDSEKWLEFWDIRNKKLIRSFEGISDENSVKWIPGKKAISYTTAKDNKTTLWVHPLDGRPEILLSGVKNMSSYEWSQDGSFIIYSINNKPEKKDQKVNLLKGMASRLPGYDNYSYLFKLDISSRKIQQLTYGSLSTSLMDISPDGKKILFGRGKEDYTKLPYSYTSYWEMDLNSMQADSITTLYWGGPAKYIEGNQKLIMRAGPSAFGEIGENIESSQVANNYDGQIYLYELSSGKVEALSKNFNPSINSFVITNDREVLYLTCTDKDYRNIYKYSFEDREFNLLKGGPDMVSSLEIASDGRKALIRGTNQQGPGLAYVTDLRKMEVEILYDPSAERLKSKKFGAIKSWTFKNDVGDEIDGRYYLPPNFDPKKKYPVIVYYYGGTTPVSRSFAGRYPYNWYAAQGYVVYIMQPRGAIGYGQKFSAEHVNNWGKTTAKDIIMGTEKFLEAHSFANPDAVACIGASYGGFMTMYLITQTDIFSAAVSHAGISALSSYWGEGYWGYAYSAVASEGAFPWNRKDIYVDQSPLFQADKVNTPILLTHGTSDTNVPPGESYQFYTALKLLDKEVEFLEVPGQDHWVLDYEKYIIWKHSIIAWFDKHLKKQDNWWNSLHGK